MHVTDPFVVVLAEMPDVFTRILATHLCDDHGRCADCALDPRLRPRWPCVVFAAAIQAQDYRMVRAASVSSAA